MAENHQQVSTLVKNALLLLASVSNELLPHYSFLLEETNASRQRSPGIHLSLPAQFPLQGPFLLPPRRCRMLFLAQGLGLCVDRNIIDCAGWLVACATVGFSSKRKEKPQLRTALANEAPARKGQQKRWETQVFGGSHRAHVYL